MRPSGEQYAIEGSGYAAVVTEVGAGLRSLTYEGRDLVLPYGIDELRPMYSGAVLAPWPNRLANGRYEFGGATHQLPIDEPDRWTALHGLVSWSSWGLSESDSSRVRLEYRLHPRSGYPFQLDLVVTYAVDASGLRWSISATNSGDVAAPYGTAPHPYLVAGPGTVDDWLLEVPATRRLELSPDRRLPANPPRTQDISGTAYDFRTARPIGAAQLDDAYTGLLRDDDGFARVRLRAGSGADDDGVELRWDDTCSWVQVYSTDVPDSTANRSALAVEPMSCPHDAFNSGTDLVVLEPGEAHNASWTISAL